MEYTNKFPRSNPGYKPYENIEKKYKNAKKAISDRIELCRLFILILKSILWIFYWPALLVPKDILYLSN